jgi:phage gp29-like protein
MARLLDQWGNPIDLTRLREEEAGPTVTGVRQIVSGHPADGLTPARLGQLLREAEDGAPIAYLELAEQMEEKDLHNRSVLSTRKNQVAGLEITVEAASDQAEDVCAADLVREWLWRDTLQEELFDVLDCIGKGFSMTEILWDTTGGVWLPARLEWRAPRWFAFDPADGRTILLRSEGGALGRLKPYGYIQHVHKSKSGLPIRGGLALAVAWMYLFKNFGVRSWVQFAEAYGRPMRIGKY